MVEKPTVENQQEQSHAITVASPGSIGHQSHAIISQTSSNMKAAATRNNVVAASLFGTIIGKIAWQTLPQKKLQNPGRPSAPKLHKITENLGIVSPYQI
ncbi:MAG: hypothetical protein K1Y36_24435 [Blastocatellia bacterium]|nr:hypothetical protein [Blastocatellia bacterium]